MFEFHRLLPSIIAHGTATPDAEVNARNRLADEPTGNLETVSADEVFGLLREFNRDHGSACLIVTHDPRLAARCDRLIELVDGRLLAA